MRYRTKTFRSAPNLSQEDALSTLQDQPFFRRGSKVVGIRPGPNKQWIATVKLAGPFPPGGGDEGGDEAPPTDDKPAFPDDGSDDGPDDSSSDDSSSEGPPSPDGGGEGEKKPKEPKGDDAIIGLLTEILHALQGGAGPEGGMGGPDALANGPSGMSAPSKGGPPHPGAGGPPGAGGKPPVSRPMRPGDAPPGSTPTGAPAFASTRQAQIPGGIAPAVGTPNPSLGQAPGAAGGTCPQCGGPEPCAMHGGGGAGGLAGQIAKCAGRLPSIVISNEDDGRPLRELISEVRPAAEQYGYKIRQARRENGRIRLFVSAH